MTVCIVVFLPVDNHQVRCIICQLAVANSTLLYQWPFLQYKCDDLTEILKEFIEFEDKVNYWSIGYSKSAPLLDEVKLYPENNTLKYAEKPW